MQMFSICVCAGYAYRWHMDMSSLCFVVSFSADPISVSPGSSCTTPAIFGPETQNALLRKTDYLLYVVLLPLFLTRRTGPEKTALLIPCPWYTSGKS